MSDSVNLRDVVKAIKEGQDPDKIIDKDRRETALHIACQKNRFATVKQLLKLGANIDAQNVMGETPLIVSFSLDKHEIPLFLIESGADVNLETLRGELAINRSSYWGRGESSELIFDALLKGTDLHHVDNKKDSILIDIASRGTFYHLTKVLELTDSGIDINYQPPVIPGNATFLASFSSLMWAAWTNKIDYVKALLEHGADIGLRSESGKDALDLAVSKDLTEVIDVLEAHIQQKEAESSDGREDSLSRSMGLSR